MNWSALTKKQQQMAIGTVVLAVAQIFILVHFLGGQDSSDPSGKSPKQELVELQEKLEAARHVIGRDAMIQNQLDQTMEELDALSVHTPTLSDRYAWAYEYVSLRSSKAGVELDSLEEISYVGDETVDPAELAYEISLSTQCSYNQLVEFLWGLERGNPLVRVKEVDITTLPDSYDRQQVRVVLQWPASLKIERGSE